MKFKHELAGLPELLAPAGGMAAFRAALAGGADAIYCGLDNALNARRAADNFDEASFEKACREAHVAGVRVYVTMNVVVHEDEIETAVEEAKKILALGADALIIQDWGLWYALVSKVPEAELHVSTQANVHDVRGTLWARDHGAARVTLSRELSLQEIADISATGVETEVFAHGAICFCYSGLCTMSAMRGDRSANRGLCAQPCRLPHILVDGDGDVLSMDDAERALCPKDNCTVDNVAELAEAGAGSLKLEGRMKAPEYVMSVVSAYREALDELGSDESDAERVAAKYRRDMKLSRAFNRDFTHAYLDGASGNDMMSYERSNNRGQLVGEVIQSTGNQVWVRTEYELGKGDLLELRPIADPSKFLTCLVDRDVPKDGVVICKVKRFMPAGTPARVLRSQAALDAVSAIKNKDHVAKRPVDVHIECKLGRPFSVTLETADGISATATGEVVEAAKTKELTPQDVVSHVCRLGTTAFAPRSAGIDIDRGCGMSFSAIHDVRAQAAEALEADILAARETRSASSLPSVREWVERGESLSGRGTTYEERLSKAEVCAVVSDPDAARAAFAAGVDRVYATTDALSGETLWGYEPIDSEWPDGVVPLLDEVCREADVERIDRFIQPGHPCVVNNISELAQAQQTGAPFEVGIGIPVHNAHSARAFEACGAEALWIGPEVSLSDLRQFGPGACVPIVATVWGHNRTMTSEHCVLQVAGKCIDDCENCALRAQKLYLRNIDDRELPVATDIHGRSRIWWSEPLDAVPEIAELLEAGATRFVVDGTIVDADAVAREVGRAKAELEAIRAGASMRPEREAGANSGHLHAGVM
jgi:putative protease